MGARLFRIFAIISFIVCLAMISLLALNLAFDLTGGRYTHRFGLYAIFHDGTAAIYFDHAGEINSRWYGGAWRVSAERGPGDFPWPTLGFAHGRGYSGQNQPIDVWIIPDWFLILISAIAPAILIWKWRRSRRRRAAGVCPNCGYDLRATPQRCPECGAVPIAVRSGEDRSR